MFRYICIYNLYIAFFARFLEVVFEQLNICVYKYKYILNIYSCIFMFILANSRLRRDFPRPLGAWRLGRHL